MLFTDPIFLFYFLPAALIIHRIALSAGPDKRYSNLPRLVLFGLTVLFYGASDPSRLVPFFICIGFDFLWASLLMRVNDPLWRRRIVAFSVFQNIGMLALFKYGWLGLVLPPGISFYIFESMSFVIDVYRKEVVPPKNPLRFFAFIGMFPRFVAGPIVRYKDMTQRFDRYKGMQIEAGLFVFSIGLFLKVCFADNFAIFTNYAFDRSGNIEFLSAWIGVFAYTMQIYFDFSGYSLMAIGLGRCLGFQFPTNFNRPYHATSIRDFWGRWHMTLCSWIRDYLYLPLASALPKGPGYRLFVILIVFLASGAWHGSTSNFLVWGLWHGTLVVLDHHFKWSTQLPRILRAPATFVLVMVGWVFFNTTTIHQTVSIFSGLFFPSNFAFNSEGLIAHPVSLGFCLLGAFYCFFIEKHIDPKKIEQIEIVQGWQWCGATAGLLLTLSWAFSSGQIPFLYFNF